jgi:hypothetical protein
MKVAIDARDCARTAEWEILVMDEAKRLAILATFLRVYGVLTLIIFGSLMIGFAVETPLLADEPKGTLNWAIWNGVHCGNQPCHVPPMLFVIYLVWAVFLFLAARKPLAYASFLSFTMWANFFHGLLMGGQALMHMDHYWSKWFTDIPFIWMLAFGIYLWGPTTSRATAALKEREAS